MGLELSSLLLAVLIPVAITCVGFTFLCLVRAEKNSDEYYRCLAVSGFYAAGAIALGICYLLSLLHIPLPTGQQTAVVHLFSYALV